MSLVAMVYAAVLLPQIEVRPVPAEIGRQVELAVVAPRSVEVIMTLPDGSTKALGNPDENGRCYFEPTQVGRHVCAATIDGVRVLAPFAVIRARSLVWWGFVSVPLGLWLLRREFSARARDRRGP